MVLRRLFHRIHSVVISLMQFITGHYTYDRFLTNLHLIVQIYIFACYIIFLSYYPQILSVLSFVIPFGAYRSIVSCRLLLIFLTMTMWQTLHSTLISPFSFFSPWTSAPQLEQCHVNTFHDSFIYSSSPYPPAVFASTNHLPSSSANR